MSRFRPNYHRAREIKADLALLEQDYEEAFEAGNFSQAQGIKDLIHEQSQALFRTGVSSEYELFLKSSKGQINDRKTPNS